MAALGFTQADFRVFKIEDFSARMGEIYARIRPKLLRLGNELALDLAHRLHMEFFPHVARHTRRTVNPPPETWAAFGPSPNGYKRYGYLALCISGAGIHARAVVKAEADGRPQMADRIINHKPQLQRAFRGTRIARCDNWECDGLPDEMDADSALFQELSDSLRKKTGGIDLGFGWPASLASRLQREEVLDAFRELEPLYRLLQSDVS